MKSNVSNGFLVAGFKSGVLLGELRHARRTRGGFLSGHSRTYFTVS